MLRVNCRSTLCGYMSRLIRKNRGTSSSLNKCGHSAVPSPVVWVPERFKSGKEDLSSIVIPVPVKPTNNPDDINVGEELSKKITKDDIVKVINKFSRIPEINILAAENGLDSKLFRDAVVRFRQFCADSETLPVDLHIIFSDILQGAGRPEDIFPYFLRHAREVYPHLDCMEELKQISDLRHPGNWYPDARAMGRKLIFHAGPTNSGKTYRALERFIGAKSGVYCGPLKLLVAEVFHKTNERGTPCDLVTGEERQMVLSSKTPADHVACTIEMVSVEQNYEVAVIDEIQMIRDFGRGWAWTRALLGIAAEEVHICGEVAAVNLVKEIASSFGEEVEVRHYNRLTSLTVESSALGELNNICPGDCIVCFSKNDIYKVTLELEQKGYECAVIYGGLPPGTKLAQAKKFNDPNHPCKILVATDAIGMGLNLSIRRIIFYSVTKPVSNENGEKQMDVIPVSQALQIGGRAGRYNTQFSEGYVTTFRSEDLPILKKTMATPVEPIERAGLHPTADQVELFAYHLPHATLSNLIDIFKNLCMMDTSSYFMCDTTNFKYLADVIQHVQLPLRARYVFCCAPINVRVPYVLTMFTKFSRQYSKNEALTVERLCRMIGWPFSPPRNVMELTHQEAVFDVLDLYLWLSYRFPDLFPDMEPIRKIQHELDEIIQQGVFNITHLLKAGATTTSDADTEEYGLRTHRNGLEDSAEEGNDASIKYPYHKTSVQSGSSSSSNSKLAKELLSLQLDVLKKLTPRQLRDLQKEIDKSLRRNCKPHSSRTKKK